MPLTAEERERMQQESWKSGDYWTGFLSGGIIRMIDNAGVPKRSSTLDIIAEEIENSGTDKKVLIELKDKIREYQK